MKKNNLLMVKEFLKDKQCLRLNKILSKILDDGGFDSVIEYIENYESVNFEYISKDDVFVRLKIIDNDLLECKKKEEFFSKLYKSLTNYDLYNSFLETFESNKINVQNNTKID